MKDFKERTVRSGAAKFCGQAANLVFRFCYVIVMARLLDPKDFGLVAMVTAFTGLYGIFTFTGLSAAAIQTPTITNEQISNLFWINFIVGAFLAFLCVLTAPMLVKFYDEPRLLWLTVIVAMGFILNAAAVQHCALLQRHLRYVALAIIETLSQLGGFIVGVVMAVAGFGYWSLAFATITSLLIFLICVWVVTQWIPGPPRLKVEIGSMLRFGGTVTLNGVVVYVAYNIEKILLGRFWGPDVLGLYGRAYQLINIPTENLNSAIGGVAFSALSRLQNDPIRYKSLFLKSYSLANSLTIPCTIFCALFANDLVLVILGSKWTAAIPIFRLLTPTVLIFGVINPLAWLLQSIRLQGRSLAISLVIVPLVVTAYVIALPYGPTGVAFAYSATMTLWLIPHVLWCLYGTPISPWDLVVATSRPFFSALVAAAFAIGAQFLIGDLASPALRLLVAGVIMATVYFVLVFLASEQRTLYLDLLRTLRGASSPTIIKGPEASLS